MVGYRTLRVQTMGSITVVLLVVICFGVALHVWKNFADEILCTSLSLFAFTLGSFCNNGEFGGTKRGGGGFGPDLSGIGPFILAPVAMGVGLLVGVLFPPFSTSEMVAMGVASAAMFVLGFVASR